MIQSYDIYSARGQWEHSGVVAESPEAALVESVKRHPAVMRVGVPYIVVLAGGPGHGRAKLLKVESVETPSYRAVQA